MRKLIGTIKTTAKGLGFVVDPKNPDQDIRLEEGTLNTALNGDTVEIEIGKDSNKVLSVISRAKAKYVGTITLEENLAIVIPDDKKCYTKFNIPLKFVGDAKKGDKVHIQFTAWNDPKTLPDAEVIRVIGKKGQNDAEMESIVLEKGFDTRFPPAVEEEAKKIEKNKEDTFKTEVPKRRDMRGTLTMTIDPIDAKDFDDAISYKKLPDGKYEIGVHIADVSHYVTEGSALDAEALHRGCSIYLVDRTIPMLPEVLSNDVCSLNPHEDKLTFSSIFIMDDKGKVYERWFGRTVINSTRRFTYEDAQASIDNGGEFADELRTLNSIAKKMQAEKFSRGAIEFEQDEIRFILDENGKPTGVYKKERLETHKLVEEYMLLANREVAKFIADSVEKNKISPGSIYRIHDVPDKERIADLAQFVKALGYDLKTKDGTVTAAAMNSLMKQVTGTPHDALVKTAAIRSMQKAIYSTKNIGHFGLAFTFYTHFTSPIRRYPDLLVHRVLQEHLTGNTFNMKDISRYQNIAEQSSEREVAASEAERASKKLKQVEYMSERVGQTFEGTISGVSEWGVYVEEVNTKCEGMIKLRDLGGDFYEFKEKSYSVVGQRTKKKFTLGDKVKFKVAGADIDRRTLDYVMVA